MVDLTRVRLGQSSLPKSPAVCYILAAPVSVCVFIIDTNVRERNISKSLCGSLCVFNCRYGNALLHQTNQIDYSPLSFFLLSLLLL